ncbi:MAG: glycosyltransferase [bacterium]
MQKIPVAIINYNGKRTILNTIKSLYEMAGVEVDIHVFDDCSTDGSPDLVREKYPEVKLHIQPKNNGKLNIMRNIAIRKMEGEIMLLTDNDILFDKKCLSELLKVMESDPAISICTPRLMFWDEPERVYYSDVKMHYIGAAIGDDRGKIVKTFGKEPVPNSGGGIMLLNRVRALEVGAFDEEFFLGFGDDGEFYQRMLRAGYKTFHVPGAFAYHEDKPFSEMRSYRAIAQIYNRWSFILSHYSIATILLLIPAFVVYEIMLFGFMLMKRLPLMYFKSNFLIFKDLPLIYKKRKQIQRMRTVSDKGVLYSGSMYIAPSLLAGNAILRFFSNLLSGFFNVYWKLVKPLIP